MSATPSGSTIALSGTPAQGGAFVIDLETTNKVGNSETVIEGSNGGISSGETSVMASWAFTIGCTIRLPSSVRPTMAAIAITCRAVVPQKPFFL